jgi:hypothetical protein
MTGDDLTRGDDLTSDEAQALRALKRDVYPPARIESVVVEALKRDGVIAAPRPWRSIVAVAATAILAFALGLMVPRAPAGPSTPSGPRFAILLYPGQIPIDAPKRRDEYAAWARQVAASGTFIQGEQLADESADASGPRGFFIISAPDAEHARAIAATCPHLKYGGRVVIRRIGDG